VGEDGGSELLRKRSRIPELLDASTDFCGRSLRSGRGRTPFDPIEMALEEVRDYTEVECVAETFGVQHDVTVYCAWRDEAFVAK